MQNNFEVIVIGGGPAGSSAAAYLARCKRRVLMLDRGDSTGFLGSLGVVSCFPGFPESISGKDLLARMHKQAELEGVRLTRDSVTALAADSVQKRIITDKNEEFYANAIVVATGAAMRTNYLHGEKEFFGRGVSHDAISDGPSVAKRITAVVGKNKQAAEAAIFLSRFAEQVHFIIPSNKLDAPDAAIEKLQNTKNVELHFSTSVKKINGSDHVASINVLSAGQERDMQVSGLFSYVHEYQLSTSFLENVVDLSNGLVKVDQSLSTNVDGVFACGDVLCGRPQLPAISSAQGILAGIGADKYLAAI